LARSIQKVSMWCLGCKTLWIWDTSHSYINSVKNHWSQHG